MKFTLPQYMLLFRATLNQMTFTMLDSYKPYIALCCYLASCISPIVGQTKVDSMLAIMDTTSSLSRKSEIAIGISHSYWTIDPNKSIEYGQTGLDLARASGDTTKIGSALNAIGHAYSLKSNYTAATSYLLEALHLFEASGNIKGSMSVSNNLGIIYTDQQHFDKALQYFLPYYKTALKDTLPARLSAACANIGVVYQHLEKFDSASYFQNQYLEISKSIGDTLGIAIAKSNLADVFYKQKLYDKALLTYQESQALSRKLQDLEGVIITLIGEARVWTVLNKAQKALPLLTKALEYADKYQLPNYQQQCYAEFAEAYGQLGQYRKALDAKNEYVNLKDSLFNKSNTQQLNALQESYTIAKKEAEIASQKVDLELLQKSEEINRLIGLMMGMGLLMLGVLTAVLYRNNQTKQRINQELANSKSEIETQRDAINTRNEELQQQQEEIIAQRDAIDEQNQTLEVAFTEITRQNNKIMSSITYAQRIQTAMLPSKEKITELFPAHTLLYLPKDIVSGDFYFIKKVMGYTVIAVADCTGHGVSGAFMSMIGNDLLNDIVRVQGITQPNTILEMLDDGIRRTLRQEQTKNRDGMDIACCTITPDGKTLQFAGAKNPLVYISQGETTVIKGDRRSIGGFSQLKKANTLPSFTLHELPIAEEMAIYMFSDGFQDQFNSENGQKVGVRRFLNLLEQYHQELNWEERQKKLNYYLLEWQGAERQIDDVLVLGLDIGQNMVGK